MAMRKEDVIAYYGRGTKVAIALGIKPSAVYQWGELVPEKRAVRLERMTKGKPQNGVVLKYRPDLYDKKESSASH